MKKLLIIAPLVLLTACASKIPSVVVLPNINEKPKQLDRTEVIMAARECVNARMKPVIQSLPQPTDHGTIIVPVAVQCEVYGPTLR
jgi:PBP1b-binding outer membrane lipoprotein LpoB